MAVRRAAMTEDQKWVAVLSNGSSASQTAAGGAASSLLPLPSFLFSARSCSLERAAIQAESRVVFPLPTEAETSTNEEASPASSSRSKRERETSVRGKRGGVNWLLSSTEDGWEEKEAPIFACCSASCERTFAVSSKRASESVSVDPRERLRILGEWV